MTYQEALDFLNGNFVSFQTAGRTAYKGGLEAITGMCRAMGDPQRDYLSIHIAGTNGKGSVAHMLASVLQAAGYRTGLYTSPHLHDFRERIRVDGEMIPQEKVAAFLDRYGKEMTERGLSYFEMTTAMAFHRFSEAGVEVAVVETGLGGRLDATNVLQPILSIITNIGMEHTALLGDTPEKIAAEKAGIIKKSIPVIIGEHDERCDPVFAEVAAANKSKLLHAEELFTCTGQEPAGERQLFHLHRTRDNHDFELLLDLAGDYQRHNIITATAAIDFLHQETPLTISRRAFLEGTRDAAAHTSLRGRWQKLGEKPLVICDTGHNAHGMAYVGEQLRRQSRDYAHLYCVLGVVNDKDLAHMFPLLPADAHYIFTRAKTHRAIPAAELAERAAAFGLQGEVVADVQQAVARARELAGPDDMIFIGGSTYVVGEAL